MFIEQYRLETNPFAADRIRPFFSSHSSRYAATKIANVFSEHIQCLGLSGPAGVGKTTLVHQQLKNLRNVTVSWIKPGTEDAGVLLKKLVREIGPGPIEAPPAELRNILQVFLRHQSGSGRRSLIVADGVERHSPEVLRELEGLSRMRLRARGVVQMMLLTRNDEIIETFIAQHDSGPLARAIHQRMSGFTLEETRAYLRASLQGASCPWFEELFSNETVADVQAFTQGVIGDIDTLVGGALELLALRSPNLVAEPRVTPGLLGEVAQKLHLKYESSPWRSPQEETLSADAVHLTDPAQLRMEAARLLVTSGGRLVAEISLDRPRMVLGRDTSCDISLDSSYVSRYQNLFMETPEGWMLIDLNSTNGCFVNGRRVSEHHLRDGDLISVGHHQLRFAGPSTAWADGGAETRTVSQAALKQAAGDPGA